MAPRRLSESEKQDLVGRYKAGESTVALAEVFGCSPNTVTRTVKALLPPRGLRRSQGQSPEDRNSDASRGGCSCGSGNS